MGKIIIRTSQDCWRTNEIMIISLLLLLWLLRRISPENQIQGTFQRESLRVIHIEAFPPQKQYLPRVTGFCRSWLKQVLSPPSVPHRVFWNSFTNGKLPSKFHFFKEDCTQLSPFCPDLSLLLISTLLPTTTTILLNHPQAYPRAFLQLLTCRVQVPKASESLVSNSSLSSTSIPFSPFFFSSFLPQIFSTKKCQILF